ncbi:MAG TPA: DUF1580 domain-containing protein [Gemmataceae bacterium]|jgi:hypothetical protein|nr:DUF1580 domain-containing protein [Gemmataceae bacterium]
MPDLSEPFITSWASRAERLEPVQPSAAVAERLITEGLISLVQAAATLPSVRGKRVSTSSIFRWIVKGKHGVRLEAIKMGGPGYWTSKPALARFAAALTAAESRMIGLDS